ncbi:MAG: Smr/MutS family protein [Pseudomonadota bacterium]
MSMGRSIPRGLSPEEQAAWAKLAESVTPLAGRKVPVRTTGEVPGVGSQSTSQLAGAMASKAGAKPQPNLASTPKPVQPRATKRLVPTPASAAPRAFNSQLDSHWNRKLKAGQIAPDYTLDLHGHSLDSAYGRIMSGIDQARAMEARVVLVIAGRDRGADPADRASKRGAIRAKLLDWLAASHHADAIAAVRRAHIRHGGEGALYLVLKRQR